MLPAKSNFGLYTENPKFDELTSIEGAQDQDIGGYGSVGILMK